MSIRSKRRKIRSKYLHPKLRRRLILFIILFLIMSGIMLFDVFSGKINFILALPAFIGGMGIGYLVGSIKKIKWAEEESLVISKMDRESAVILVLYLSFSLSRKWFFGHWLQGEMLSAFCFSLAAGILLGRFLSTRIKIRKVLKDQRYLVKPPKKLD